MTKKLLFVLMMLALIFTVLPQQNANAYDPTSSFNHWLYLNLNLGLTPNWSIHAMPGHSYEYTYDDPNIDNERDPRGTFLTEFFIGPWYSTKLTDALSFRVGVEYYYMGFSATKDDDSQDWYNHCLEIIPTFGYKIDDTWSLGSRTIFHNVLFTSDRKSIDGDEDKSGYGMLIREMLTINYSLNSLITLSLSNEFFFGCVEDEYMYTTHKYTKGFNENRFIPGITFKNLAPGLSVTANYIWRAILNTDDMEPHPMFDKGEIIANMHYIMLILTYNYNLF